MPHIYAHNKMAELVQDNLSDQAGKIVKTYDQAFFIGAQGPDPFFVYPSIKNAGYKYGVLLHKYKTGEIMSSFIDTAMEDQVQRDLYFSYIAGYLCHYSLDCAAHPYILYMAGKGIGHTQFETYIDVELMHYYGTDSYKTPLYSYLNISEEDALKIGRLYESAISNVYDIPIKDKDYYKALKTLKKAHRALYDKNGRKIKTLGVIERAIKKPYMLTCVINPNRSVHNSLNKYNQPWCLPWDSSKVKTDSFLDIQSKSAEEASMFIDALYKAMYIQEDTEAVKQLIGSRSFETGMPFEQKKQMKYCKNVIVTART